jgi:hypothetical protein
MKALKPRNLYQFKDYTMQCSFEAGNKKKHTLTFRVSHSLTRDNTMFNLFSNERIMLQNKISV